MKSWFYRARISLTALYVKVLPWRSKYRHFHPLLAAGIIYRAAVLATPAVFRELKTAMAVGNCQIIIDRPYGTVFLNISLKNKRMFHKEIQILA